MHEILGHHAVTLLRFHAFRNHGLVGHEQQGTRRNVVGKSGGEQSRRFHIHCHGTGLQQVFLELLIVFPDAAVGGVHRSGPVVA